VLKLRKAAAAEDLLMFGESPSCQDLEARGLREWIEVL
jgi:hypothetical protein